MATARAWPPPPSASIEPCEPQDDGPPFALVSLLATTWVSDENGRRWEYELRLKYGDKVSVITHRYTSLRMAWSKTLGRALSEGMVSETEAREKFTFPAQHWLPMFGKFLDTEQDSNMRAVDMLKALRDLADDFPLLLAEVLLEDLPS